VHPSRSFKSFLQFPNDPDFPYVGKFIANLTLAQIKTLDCGSLRQDEFREFFRSIREGNGIITLVWQLCS
jgi:hypothetical protein